MNKYIDLTDEEVLSYFFDDRQTFSVTVDKRKVEMKIIEDDNYIEVIFNAKR